MPRSQQQNQHLKEARREQIMQAALTVFAHKGLAATKISDIAAACDLSYGLIYHYFHDKDELYMALVERALQGAMWVTVEIQEQPGPAWERLCSVCTAMLEGARSTPEYFQLILQAQVNERAPSAVYTLIARFGTPILQQLTMLIRQAQAEGQVVAIEANELAFTLLAVIQGICLSQSFGIPDPPQFPRVETVLRFLRPSLSVDEESSHAH